MNIYLIVEGESTEMQLYPVWLSQLLPQYERSDQASKAAENNYYIFSGGGIPAMYRHVANAIRDINKWKNYGLLLVCLDSEELSPERRREKLMKKLAEEEVELGEHCRMQVIVHHRCLETWFLGNPKIYVRNPQSELARKYTNYYNVAESDPELMERPDPKHGLPDFKLTAHFHLHYLRELFKEKGIRYTKSNPGEPLEKHYLEQLIARTESFPNHLRSFQTLLETLQPLHP